MARTVGDVLAAARGIVQDQAIPYRYSDADIVGYVSEAMAEAKRVRADLFLNSFRTTPPFYTTADLNTPLPISDTYFAQVVNYVAGRTDLREDTFAQDGRAVTLITAFNAALTGGRR